MKKLLVLSLVLLMGVTAFAKTNYFDSIYVEGTFTTIGDIDSSGKCDFQYSPPTGTGTNGHILKTTLTTATAYSGTTAGLAVKNYFSDTGVTVTGGEFTGLYVNVKQLAALTGGAKSSIISGHNYGTGGDYQSLDYGAILYGDTVWGFVLSGGTSTYGLYFGDQTISTADIYLQNGATIGEVVDGVLQVDGTTSIEIDGNLYVEDATNAGVVYLSTYNIVYTQTDSAVTVCTLPANSYVTDVKVMTTTAFNDSGTVTCDIGWAGTLEGYAGDLDIKAADGWAYADVYSNFGLSSGGSTRDILMSIADQNDNGTAGAATVYIEWTMKAPGSL